LVNLKVDVIVTYFPPAIQAAKQAKGTIPIVMAGIIDPVATGRRRPRGKASPAIYLWAH
jgi:putative tryptophan/tyrosine transport system substrate-binding protein